MLRSWLVVLSALVGGVLFISGCGELSLEVGALKRQGEKLSEDLKLLETKLGQKEAALAALREELDKRCETVKADRARALGELEVKLKGEIGDRAREIQERFSAQVETLNQSRKSDADNLSSRVFARVDEFKAQLEAKDTDLRTYIDNRLKELEKR